MKTLTTFVLLILFILGCKQDEVINPKGLLKRISYDKADYVELYSYGSNGLVKEYIRGYLTTDNIPPLATFKYKGNTLLEAKMYIHVVGDKRVPGALQCFYSKSNTLDSTQYTYNGKLLQKFIFQSNDKNQIIKAERYTIEYSGGFNSYNIDPNAPIDTTTRIKSVIDGTYSFFYDDRGNVTRDIFKSIYWNDSHDFTYTYDDSKNPFRFNSVYFIANNQFLTGGHNAALFFSPNNFTSVNNEVVANEFEGGVIIKRTFSNRSPFLLEYY